VDRHQTEANQTAEALDARIPVAPTSRRWNGQPYFIRAAQPLHGLQQQIEIEAALHLDHGQPLRQPIPYSHCIAAVHLALHLEPGSFQELLHGWIK
jgi:hypothetical protein